MGAEDFSEGASLPELRVTPDKYLALRYAGASGDYNPIHIDPEFALEAGLPGPILHGLWTMAQVARAHTQAAGGPAHLKRLTVQFRGMGALEQEIAVTAAVTGDAPRAAGERVIVKSRAEQAGRRIVRNGEAELEFDGSCRLDSR